jgi:peptidoglycan/xylan/chitin deacetylase (PgdA/CDA1 family)
MDAPGGFTISIDTELAWGVCHRPILRSEYDALSREREVIGRLLALFSKYDVRATWAVVGHLFLAAACKLEDGVVHPEISRPITRTSTHDWFFQHPRDGVDPLWYARDVVDSIRDTLPPQEIGSHSFCHLPFDERSTRAETIRTDVQMAKHLHQVAGIPFRAFVFPWNTVGYREVLAEAGICVYRGRSSRWYDPAPAAARRLFNILHYLLALSPPTVRPTVDGAGMINVPDSMLLLSRAGVRRLVPPQALVRMASAGLRRAVARGEVFHLWFHPSDFVFETDRQFWVLETILQAANRLRDRSLLEVLTMGDVQKRVTETPRRAPSGHNSPWATFIASTRRKRAFN